MILEFMPKNNFFLPLQFESYVFENGIGLNIRHNFEKGGKNRTKVINIPIKKKSQTPHF